MSGDLALVSCVLILSKGKQQIGALFCRKQPIETQTAVKGKRIQNRTNIMNGLHSSKAQHSANVCPATRRILSADRTNQEDLSDRVCPEADTRNWATSGRRLKDRKVGLDGRRTLEIP